MQCLVARHSITLKRFAPKRCFSALPKPELEVENLVIGGGVVGLALAERLARQRKGESTILVERHSRVGEETRYVAFILPVYEIFHLITPILSALAIVKSYMLACITRKTA